MAIAIKKSPAVESWTYRPKGEDPTEDRLIQEYEKVYNFVARETSKCFQLILDGKYAADEEIVIVDITHLVQNENEPLPKRARERMSQIGTWMSPNHGSSYRNKIIGRTATPPSPKDGRYYWGTTYRGKRGITRKHREYMKAIARSLKWDGEKQYTSKIKLIEDEVRVRNATSPVWSRIAKPPKKSQVKIDRVIRSIYIKSEIKKRYLDKCFICEETIQVKKGNYSEAAHIRPLGKGGCDSFDNVIVLCPNHHVEFDYGMVTMMMVDKQTLKIVHKNEENEFNEKSVKLHPTHELNSEYLEYHYKKIFNKR